MYANGGASDAGVDAEFMFFANQRQQQPRSQRRGQKRRAGGGCGGGGGGGFAGAAAAHGGDVDILEAEPKEAPKYVALDRVESQHRKRNVREHIRRRARAVTLAAAEADGQAADDVGDESTIDGELREEIEATGGALTVNAIRGEMAAARVDEDAMYYSSCSEEEEVLTHTLRVMRAQSSLAPFEEDSEHSAAAAAAAASRGGDSDSHARHRHKPSARRGGSAAPSVPQIIENCVFDENTRSGMSTATNHHHHRNHKQGDETLEYGDDSCAQSGDASNADISEQQQSKRERVNRLRLHVHSEQRRRGNPPAECFKCMWGNSQYDAVNAQPVYQLFSLMENEIGRRELRAVAKIVHKFFKHAIYLPMVRVGKYICMWRTRDIYVHLTEHEMSPQIFLYRNLRKIEVLKEVLSHETHVYDPEKRRVVTDNQNIRSYLEAVKLSMQMMSADPEKLLFNDKSANFDIAAAAGSGAGGGGGGGGGRNVSSIGRYELRPIEAPNAVNVRNK